MSSRESIENPKVGDRPTLLSQFVFSILSLSDTDSLWPVVTGKVVLELGRCLRYVFKREPRTRPLPPLCLQERVLAKTLNWIR